MLCNKNVSSSVGLGCDTPNVRNFRQNGNNAREHRINLRAACCSAYLAPRLMTEVAPVVVQFVQIILLCCQTIFLSRRSFLMAQIIAV